MNSQDVQNRLRELHRDGERTRFVFDIDPLGQESFTVQRITGGVVHVGSSLKNAEDALYMANDSVANADMHEAVESQLARR